MKPRAVSGFRERVALLIAAMAALIALGAPGTSSASASTTYMSCGWPPTYTEDPDLASEGQIRYAVHPRHCYWSDNGATYRLVNLVGLRWRNWGGDRATARGKIVDNHDQDRNGFQRHAIRVEVLDPRPPVGYPEGSKLYYTKLRVIPFTRGSRPFVERLYRPGQGPVRLSLQGKATAPTSARVALPGDDFHECGPTPGMVEEYPPSYPYVRGPVGCKLADRIARRYAAKVLASDYETWAHDIEGFRCRLLGYYGDGTVARCGGSHRRVIKIVSGG